MLETTVGQLLVNEPLPPDLRDYNRVLDKKGIAALLQQLAEKHPDKYRDTAKQLLDVARDSAYTTGGHGVALEDLRPTLAARKARMEMHKELQALYADRRLSRKQREDEIVRIAGNYQKHLVEDVFKESRDEDNPLARQITGAGRGNKFQLNSLRGFDTLYVDHRGNVVPIPVTRSYSQGLTPVEYFAGSFGARKGVIDLKMATPDAGFLGKQLVQASHRLLVSALDGEDIYDKQNPRGFPVDTDDGDNEGALLAHPVGDYPRNTELTPRILKDLKSRGIDRILVRSPTVGGPADGGVYARDVGRRERGRIAPIGDYVGIAAAQALSEPLTQAQISSKHSGGVAGASAKAISGFKHINQLVQVPSHFQGGAAHSELDGTVQDIREAPQGGQYVVVNGKEHHVPQDAQLLVKKGDTVEAGDVLSAGIPNPAKIVQHKGVGEGRRYFVKAFRDAISSGGQYGNRRNIELISRGLINHVQLHDEVGDYAPGDTIPYHVLEHSWEPRPGHIVSPPQYALNHYLEKPVLHYTVGTKIRPSMLKEFQHFGVDRVYAHRDPPPFEPTMVRGMANVANDPDWMARFLGSYQQKSLLTGVHRGATSDELGTSFTSALARGENFGRVGPTQGWKFPGGPDSNLRPG